MGPRSLVAAVLCFLTFFTIGASASNQGRTNLTIVDIPGCGLQCFLGAIPKSSCSPMDTACVCKSKEIVQPMASCMLANCTMQEALDSSRVQAQLCNLPHETRSHEAIIYTSIIYGIAVLCVSLRIWAKWMASRLSWDDLVVVIALLIVTVPFVLIIDMIFKGFGKHFWNLDDGMLPKILLRFYASWSMFIIVMCLLKSSLVLFYLEIFVWRQFRILALTLLGLIIINSIIIFGIAAIPCWPVESFWNRDLKGKCMDIQANSYSVAISALVQDLLLLILPLSFLGKLEMSRARKFAVGLMFCIGGFGMIATLIRIPTLVKFKISNDPTWDYVVVAKWSQFELAAGFVCISFPAIRILVTKFIPEKVKQLPRRLLSKPSSHTPSYSKPSTDRAPRSNPPDLYAWSNISETSLGTHTHTQTPTSPLAVGSKTNTHSRTSSRIMSVIWPRSPPAAIARTSAGTRPREIGSMSSECSMANMTAPGSFVFPFQGSGTTRGSVEKEKFEMVGARGSSSHSDKCCEDGKDGSRRVSCQTCDEAHDELTELPYADRSGVSIYSHEDLERNYHELQQKRLV